jgi:hypothetical protein
LSHSAALRGERTVMDHFLQPHIALMLVGLALAAAGLVALCYRN